MHINTFLKEFERLYTIIPSEFHDTHATSNTGLKIPSLSHCPSCGHLGDEEDDETPWYGEDGPSDFFAQKPAADISFINPVTIAHFFPFLKSKDTPREEILLNNLQNKFKLFTNDIHPYMKTNRLPKEFGIMTKHLRTNHNRFIYTIERYELYKRIIKIFSLSNLFDKTFSLEDKSPEAYDYWKKYENRQDDSLYNLRAWFCTDCLDDIYIYPSASTTNIFKTLSDVPNTIVTSQFVPIYTYTALNLAFIFTFSEKSEAIIPQAFPQILKPHTTL